ALRRIAPPADEVFSAVFGYSAPHLSARGSSTLLSDALLTHTADLPATPHTARPISHELPVDPMGLPVLHLVSSACLPSPLPRQVRWSVFARPSPWSAAYPMKKLGRLCNCCFGACSAFTHVMTCTLAESPTRSFPSKAPTASLPPLSFRLPRGERTSSEGSG